MIGQVLLQQAGQQEEKESAPSFQDDGSMSCKTAGLWVNLSHILVAV